jgi:hypothetical protein
MAAMIARLQREWLLTSSATTLLNGFVANCANAGAKQSHTRGTPCFSPEDEFLIQWGSMVSEYTQRGLTYQTDKLIAIQGIADALMSTYNCTDGIKPEDEHISYYAGAWTQTTRSTVLSLLWSISLSRNKKNQTTKDGTHGSNKDGQLRLDIAPSWSWASTTEEVQWPAHLLHRLEPRLEVRQIVRDGARPGELLVEANVKAALLGRETSGRGKIVLSAISGWSDRHGLTSNGAEAEDGCVSTSPPGLPLAVEDIRAPEYVFLDGHFRTDGAEWWAVWLAEVAVGEVHARVNKRQIHCLVLRKSTNGWEVRNNTRYMVCKRVGYCAFDEDKWRNGSESDMRRVGLCII